jgi:hypothetical protein
MMIRGRRIQMIRSVTIDRMRYGVDVSRGEMEYR